MQTHRQQDEWETVFQAVPQPLFILSPGYDVISVNRAALRVLNKRTSQVVGRKCYRLFHAADGPVENCPLKQLLSGGIPETAEIHMQTAGGTYLVSCTPIYDRTGALMKVLHMAVDITARRKAEMELRKSADVLRGLMKATQETLLLVDTTGTVIMANEVVAGRLGTSVQALIGSSLYDHFPSDVAMTRRAAHDEVVATGQPVHFVDARAGRYYASHAYPVFSGDGAVSQIAIFAHDVTQLKQDEKKLQESEERYRAAIEKSNDGVVIVQAGKLIFCNRKFVEILRYDTAGEINAAGIASIVHPEDRERVVDYARRRQRGEPAPPQYEMRLVRKDGSTVHTESSSARIIVDGEPASLGFIRDITERKEAEEERMKLSSAVETAGEGIFMLTPDGRYSYANAAWLGIFGFTEKEILGQSSGVTRPASYPESLRRAIWAELEAGNTWSGRQTRARKDGRPIEVETTIAPVKDVSGTIIHYVGVERDITRQLEIEAQFLQAQKMEAIGTLAGGVAHDFNNILTVIMGFGNMIQDNIELSDRIKPYIDQIVASCAKAADLTRSLLAYSRKQAIALEAHRMGELVANTANLLKRLLPEDVDLKLDLENRHAVALVDVTQIDQVLMNLATNARDAMPHGGTITIRLRTTQLDASFSDSHGFGKPGSYIQLSVADTGTGMDEKTLARIFDPFFTTKEVGQGTGLGLSSVYGIVKQHKGYITVASAPLRGTVFDIYLPLAKGTVVPGNIEKAPVVGGTETILVVEDDADVRQMLVAVLAGQNYTILAAADGEDAINIFNAHEKEIDLIILDIIMPGMNGKEVLDEITSTSPGVKAIFMSGYAGDILFAKGVRHEGIEFMQKPISVPDLLGRIRQVLDR